MLDREIDTIATLLDEHGPLSRDEIARRLGTRRWGPGRFRYAIAEAESEGRNPAAVAHRLRARTLVGTLALQLTQPRFLRRGEPSSSGAQ